jgi:hypothetical protein
MVALSLSRLSTEYRYGISLLLMSVHGFLLLITHLISHTGVGHRQ